MPLHRCLLLKLEVLCVLWPIAGESTAQLVQAKIPVDPALAAGVEVGNDVHAIAFPRLICERQCQKP